MIAVILATVFVPVYMHQACYPSGLTLQSSRLAANSLYAAHIDKFELVKDGMTYKEVERILKGSRRDITILGAGTLIVWYSD